MTDLGRLVCVVPRCGRTSRPNGHAEWLCAEHWRLVDRALKLKRMGLRHRLRRRGELERDGAGLWRILSPRALRLEAGLWRRMKRQAIERAAGI